MPNTPLGSADFTSISAFRHFNTFNREDQDGTNRQYLYFDDANIEENKSYSQEFTLSGKTGIADWVAGASYYYDDAHQTSQLNLYTDGIDTLLKNTGLVPGGIYGPISQAAAPVRHPGVAARGYLAREHDQPWLFTCRSRVRRRDLARRRPLEPDHGCALHAR